MSESGNITLALCVDVIHNNLTINIGEATALSLSLFAHV